jgi:hypothetical protein
MRTMKYGSALNLDAYMVILILVVPNVAALSRTCIMYWAKPLVPPMGLFRGVPNSVAPMADYSITKRF